MAEWPKNRQFLTAIILTSKVDRTEKMINKIIEWCNNIGLEIATDKTKILLWTRSQRIEARKIEIGNIKTKYSEHVKYLGIYIDNKLSFKKHIDHMTQKCRRTILWTRRAIGKKWGITPKMTEWLYKTIIIPKVTYCSIVWAYNMTKRQEEQLETIQTMAQRLITRSIRSTPRAWLNLILNMQPLSEKAKETALKRALALKQEGHWVYTPLDNKDSYHTTCQRIDQILQNNIKLNIRTKTDRITPVNNMKQKFKVIIPNTKVFKIKSNNDQVIIYTDGSTNEKTTGYGVHFSDPYMGIIDELYH